MTSPSSERIVLSAAGIGLDLLVAYVSHRRKHTPAKENAWRSYSRRLMRKLLRATNQSSKNDNHQDSFWATGRGATVSRWLFSFILVVVTLTLLSNGDLPRFLFGPPIAACAVLIPDLFDWLSPKRASIEVTNERGRWAFRLGFLVVQIQGVVAADMLQISYQYRALTNRIVGGLLFLEDFDDIVLSTVPLYLVFCYLSPDHITLLTHRLFNLSLVALFTTAFQLR